MNITESLAIALKQLASNKLRSVLSLVGILIAVGAVTGIVSLGDGLQAAIYQEFEQIGGFTTIWTWAPSPWYRDESGNWVRRNWEEHITLHDVEAIKAETDKVDFIVSDNGASMSVSRGDVAIGSSQVEFTTPEMIISDNLTIAKGRFLTNLDLINNMKVAVLGWNLAKNLFEPSENPIGKEVKIQGMRFTVVGVTEEKSFFDNNYDDRLIAPITTAFKRVYGNDYIDYLVVKAKTPEDVNEVVKAIRRVYRRIHEHGDEMEIPA